jgi:hypothetical protein
MSPGGPELNARAISCRPFGLKRQIRFAFISDVLYQSVPVGIFADDPGICAGSTSLPFLRVGCMGGLARIRNMRPNAKIIAEICQAKV